MNKFLNEMYFARLLTYSISLRLNKMPTLICNNCVAGVIYSDLNQQFISPTINLYFFQRDFLKFCNNLKYCCEFPLVETLTSKYGTFEYPIGLLGDLGVHFMHYSTLKLAQESWYKRVKRIKWDNIRVIDIGRETWGRCIFSRL